MSERERLIWEAIQMARQNAANYGVHDLTYRREVYTRIRKYIRMIRDVRAQDERYSAIRQEPCTTERAA